MSMTNDESGFFNRNRKRSWLITGCTLIPAFRYFHQHRTILLGSGMFRKTSYYDPKAASTLGTSSYNKIHHIKEIGARLFLGYIAGWCLATYFFGVKPKEVNISAEEAESLQDEESL